MLKRMISLSDENVDNALRKIFVPILCRANQIVEHSDELLDLLEARGVIH